MYYELRVIMGAGPNDYYSVISGTLEEIQKFLDTYGNYCKTVQKDRLQLIVRSEQEVPLNLLNLE